jgi:hypothetical protein
MTPVPTEVVPKASRIAVLWNGANLVKLLDFKETEVAAQVLGYDRSLLITLSSNTGIAIGLSRPSSFGI